MKPNKQTSSKEHIKERVRYVWIALKRLHNLVATPRQFSILSAMEVSSRQQHRFSGCFCFVGWSPDVSGDVSDNLKEDRQHIRLLSSPRLSVCPSVSVNSEALWSPDIYDDSMIPFSTTLTPLSLWRVPMLPLCQLHPHIRFISFHRHILLCSFGPVYNTNRAKVEWNDIYFKRINWQAPRGKRQGIDFIWK